MIHVNPRRLLIDRRRDEIASVLALSHTKKASYSNSQNCYCMSLLAAINVLVTSNGTTCLIYSYGRIEGDRYTHVELPAEPVCVSRTETTEYDFCFFVANKSRELSVICRDSFNV